MTSLVFSQDRANALDLVERALELHGFHGFTEVHDPTSGMAVYTGFHGHTPFASHISSSVLHSREKLYGKCLDFLEARKKLKGE